MNNLGTVKFEGEINDKTWYGIEWDDRIGKHDGTANNQRYFTGKEMHCSFLLTNNSKIKFINEKSQIITTSFSSEFKLKYSDFSLTNKVVSLSNKNITEIDDISNCDDFQELDLSANKIKHLKSIKLIENFSNLNILNLNYNKLEQNKTCFISKSLTVLCLNNCAIEWTFIDADFMQTFPNLIELHLSNNNLTTLQFLTIQNHFKLKVFDISNNNLDFTKFICICNSFKYLERINMEHNYITEISSNFKDINFKTIKYLNLDNNFINDWISLHNLNKIFPNLTELRIKNNPILNELSKSDLRSVLIARIEKINILNGSSIDYRQRRDCELYYLNRMEEEKSSLNEIEFASKHPRYNQLIDIYGVPIITKVDLTSNILKNRLITVSFSNIDVLIEKRIPCQISIRQLKLIAVKLFRLKEYHDLFLKYNYLDEEIVLDETRDISYYNVKNGDQIKLC